MSAAPAPRSPVTAAADLARLTEIVEQFRRQTIALFGDFVADEFQSGDIARVSREAPVLILRHRETQLLPGGGANAANNLVDLGARVRPVSVVGDDAAGRALLDYFRRKRVDTFGIISLRGWTTPTKTRFLAGWAHTVPQQVLRVDRQSSGPLPPGTHDALKRKLRAAIREGGPLLVSDYGYGGVTPDLVREAASHSRRKLVIALDSRFALHSFRGAGITVATPNEAELESLHHTLIGLDPEALERCGRQTLKQLRLRALVVLRGERRHVQEAVLLRDEPLRAEPDDAHADGAERSLRRLHASEIARVRACERPLDHRHVALHHDAPDLELEIAEAVEPLLRVLVE